MSSLLHDAVRKVLKKKSHTVILNLVRHISVVAARVRLAYLVDGISLHENEVESLIAALHAIELKELRVLTLAETHVFLVNVSLLEQLDMSNYFVDVTPLLDRPKVVSQPDLNLIVEDLSRKLRLERCMQLVLPDNLIIPLTGILLEYQVVYVLDNPRQEMNALASKDLTIVKTFLSDESGMEFEISSFSFPTSLLDVRTVLDKVNTRWTSRMQQLDDATLWHSYRLTTSHANVSRLTL